jgi:hypothetical protein
MSQFSKVEQSHLDMRRRGCSLIKPRFSPHARSSYRILSLFLPHRDCKTLLRKINIGLVAPKPHQNPLTEAAVPRPSLRDRKRCVLVVLAFALTDPNEIWVLDSRDMKSAFNAAKYRARRRGIGDGAAPVPPCIATVHDDVDGAVSRVRRRLGKWQIVGARFHENAEIRAALAVIQYENLRRRQMI